VLGVTLLAGYLWQLQGEVKTKNRIDAWTWSSSKKSSLIPISNKMVQLYGRIGLSVQ
jgi:hypothetical protein